MSNSMLVLLLLLSLNIPHVEIKELPYVLSLIRTNSPKSLYSPIVFTLLLLLFYFSLVEHTRLPL